MIQTAASLPCCLLHWLQTAFGILLIDGLPCYITVIGLETMTSRWLQLQGGMNSRVPHICRCGRLFLFLDLLPVQVPCECRHEYSSAAFGAIWSSSVIHFNGHFPGGPGLAGIGMSPLWILLELRVLEVVVTTGAIRHAKLKSKWHHQQTNIQFLRARCPSCRPASSVKAYTTDTSKYFLKIC